MRDRPPVVRSTFHAAIMKTINTRSDIRMGFAWWERLGHAIRKSMKGDVMLPASEHVFYLLCDLDDAFADLSIAMDKWHIELEKGNFDADNTAVLTVLETIRSLLDQINKDQV